MNSDRYYYNRTQVITKRILILVKYNDNYRFSKFFKNNLISNFMEICHVEAEFFYADISSDGHIERNDETI